MTYVKVIRLLGGFGLSSTSAIHLADSDSSSCPGNREHVCPSGPIPNRIKSKVGYLAENAPAKVWTNCCS